MKKIIAILLALTMLALTGCGSKAELEAKQAEVDALNGQVESLSNQIKTLTGEKEALASQNTLQAINATVDGQNVLEFSGEASFTASAVLAEGQFVDHWLLNGQLQENTSEDTFTFTVNSDAVVQAVLREEKKVTTINAELRFLDEKGNPAGDPTTEVVFEEDYTNPVTGETCEGGKISAEIKAVIPAGKIVDYWLINGVQYYLGTGVSAFVVEGLDETTTYEVVLKDKPITYYTVSCTYCSFNGKTKGSVAAGSTITVVGDGNFYREFYVNGSLIADYVKSITIQINSDTTIYAYAIIN